MRLAPFFEYFFTEFEAAKPAHVMFLGDTFHIRSATDPRDHRLFTDILQRIINAPWSPQVHLLVGNQYTSPPRSRRQMKLTQHSDMKNKVDRADNSLYPFAVAHGKIHVYAEITETLIDGVEATFIPYHSDESIIRDYLKEQGENMSTRLLFFHGSVNGAVVNSSRLGRKQICTESALDRKSLGKAKLAFLGHFHKHGPVAGDQRVVYVGAPIQSNAGDVGDLEHGLVVYDPATEAWELRRNPHAEYYLTSTLSGVESLLPRVRGKVVQLLLEPGEDDADAIQAALDSVRAHGARTAQAITPTPKETPSHASTSHFDIKLEDMLDGFMSTRLALPGCDPTLEENRKSYLLSILRSLPHATTTSHPDLPFIAEITTITMQNFRGIRGTTVLDLAALPPGEVFLVSGKNGSGKSTMIEAVVWCLFGRFLSTNLASEDIAHRGTRETLVTLEFANGYSITRSRRGRKTKLVDFTITRPDGTKDDVGHSAAATTEYFARHYLGTGLSMFKQTCVIGDNAEYFTRSASDKERSAAMDELFGLDDVVGSREMIQERAKTLEGELADVAGRIEVLKSRIEESEKQIKAATEDVARCEREIEEKGKNVREDEEVLQEVAGELKKLQQEKRWYEEEVQKCESQLREVRGAVFQQQRALFRAAEHGIQFRMDAIAVGIRQLSGGIEAAAKRLQEQQVQYEKQLREQRRVLNTLRRIWSQLLDAIAVFWHGDRIVPEDSDWSPKTMHIQPGLTDDLLPAPQESHEFTSSLSAISTEKSQARSALSSHLSTLHALQNQLQEASTKSSSTTNQLRQLHNKKHTLETRSSYCRGSLSSLQSRLEHLTTSISALKDTNNTHTTNLTALTSQLETLQTSSALAAFWLSQLRDTDRIKGPFLTHCRTTYIAHINTLLQTITPALNPDSSTLLTFRITPSLTIQPSGHGALSLGERSRGQLTRTYLALFLAMFMIGRERLRCRPGFIFMDEVVDALDQKGIDGLQGWLEGYVAGTGVRAFLLTHREKLMVGNVVDVVKGEEGGVEYILR